MAALPSALSAGRSVAVKLGRRFSLCSGFWLAALVVSLILSSYSRDWLPRWALQYPRQWVVPIKNWINDFMGWLLEDAGFGLFTFKELTRGIAWLLDWPPKTW